MEMASHGKLFDRLESAGEDKVQVSSDEKIRAAYDDLLRKREATDLRLKIVNEEINKLEILKEEKEKVRQIIAEAKATKKFFKREL